MNITLSIAQELWREFHAECVRRGLKASQVVAQMMREQLARWQEAGR